MINTFLFPQNTLLMRAVRGLHRNPHGIPFPFLFLCSFGLLLDVATTKSIDAEVMREAKRAV
jgi:hypothetical protein